MRLQHRQQIALDVELHRLGILNYLQPRLRPDLLGQSLRDRYLFNLQSIVDPNHLGVLGLNVSHGAQSGLQGLSVGGQGDGNRRTRGMKSADTVEISAGLVHLVNHLLVAELGQTYA